MINQDGFTLLELIVAVAILALLAVPMTNSVQRGVAIWQTSHDSVTVSEQVILRRNRIAGWLRAAYPFVPGRTSGAVRYPLVGNQDAMQFLTALHPDTTNNTFYVAHLELANDPSASEASARMLSLSVATDYESAATFGETSILASGIETAKFTYLGMESGDWLEAWENKANLPRAVKISVTFFDKKKVWPELVVALLTEEWAHCAYDSISLQCRTQE